VALEVYPLSPGIGAEIRGVRLASISDADFRTVYAAWLQHLVLVVRDQQFTIEEFLRYSARFGRPTPHVIKKTRHPDYPALTVMGGNVAYRDGGGKDVGVKRGEGWHTDTAFMPQPAKATQLYALAIPSYGGDTLFASMYAAYDALPTPMKARLETLEAVFCCDGKNKDKNLLMDDEERQRPPVRHPVVRVHPETGRKALYVNPTHTLAMADMAPDEGDALLEDLYARMMQPGFEYRHKWRVGDVVIWDNRCCIHSATGGYPLSERRVHWRTTIMDDGAKTPARRSAA
jgi:taurine dioxygenase